MAWKRNETSELLIIHHAGLKPYTSTAAEYAGVMLSCNAYNPSSFWRAWEVLKKLEVLKALQETDYAVNPKKKARGKASAWGRRVESREDEEDAQRKETPTVRAANVVSSGTGAPGTCTARARAHESVRRSASGVRLVSPANVLGKHNTVSHDRLAVGGQGRATRPRKRRREQTDITRPMTTGTNGHHEAYDNRNKRTSRGIYDNGGGVVVNYDDA
ncbi:unnamed protein product [Sphagnum balticum]